MSNEPNPEATDHRSSERSTRLAIISKGRPLDEVIQSLERYPDRPTDQHALISVGEARAVVATFEASSAPCPPPVARRYAARLVEYYPPGHAQESWNPRTYAAGMTALLSSYAEEEVKQICDPVSGLPSRLKWLPTLAETKEALDAERAKRNLIRYRAAWTIKEAERRRKDAEERATWGPPKRVLP